MSTFVSIRPDPFASNFRGAAINRGTEDRADYNSSQEAVANPTTRVRRPVRGLQLKDDTYATLQVRSEDGKNTPLIDAGGSPFDFNDPSRGYTELYTNFLLQSIQEQRAEKMQIVQTFGEPFVFFFGEHPRIIVGSGILLNTEDFNWRAEFWENYDKYLRGTRCVQTKTRVTMQWDDILVEGYFIKANAAESATKPNQVEFDFQLFLTNYANISSIGEMEFPRASAEGVNIEPDTLEIFGANTGGFQSSTQEVRRKSITSLNTAGIGVKNSLLDTIRSKVTGFLTIDGRLTSFIEAASRIASGRNIRVPLGFTGGSVFDQETQIALASVDTSSGQILLTQRLGGQTFTIQSNIVSRGVGNPKFGLISLNSDEYISRLAPTPKPLADPAALDPFQKIDADKVRDEVVAVFEAFGVDVEPPDEATIAAKKAAFGFFSLIASTITHNSPGAARLRQKTNIIS